MRKKPVEINIHAALNFVRLNRLIANPIATICNNNDKYTTICVTKRYVS